MSSIKDDLRECGVVDMANWRVTSGSREHTSAMNLGIEVLETGTLQCIVSVK